LVDPILLTPPREPFNDPAWLFEPKYDGYRGLLYVTGQGCHFRSKGGNILKRFEQLCYWVRGATVKKRFWVVRWSVWTTRGDRTSGTC
jgi:ATP-dependent DNA ligase